jgi:hypothetical protein|tara:strand:- start:7504 stop:7710 length:207 start_codon:yes stop_codon:yes gene_type:complete
MENLYSKTLSETGILISKSVKFSWKFPFVKVIRHYMTIAKAQRVLNRLENRTLNFYGNKNNNRKVRRS